MNNKGITLITVVVMIIVMIIIAAASILAGNKLIVNSSEYKKEQEIQSVREAVSRKKTEVGLQGTFTPVGEGYVGEKNPILISDENGTVEATDWYLLDTTALEKLGVYEVNTKFLANYDYEIVLSTENPYHIEEYFVITAIHYYKDQGSVVGEMLNNKTSDNPNVKMVEDSKGNLYGTGWYIVDKGDFPTEYANYINNKYLVNFNTCEYVIYGSDFSEVNS